MNGPGATVWSRATTLLAVVALLASCGAETGETVAVGAPPPTSGLVALPPSTASVAGPDVTELGHLATFTENPAGAILPDAEVTPGAVFDDVGVDDVCNLHYPQGIRQPRFNDKVEAFSRYGVSIHDRDLYQVDHLVPIGLGGSNALENLWPQPYDGVIGASDKDILEQQLHMMVCDQQLSLEEAQQVIATDWWQAYETYVEPVEGSPGTAPETDTETTGVDPGGVMNGGPCPEEGAVGYTEPKRVPLLCVTDGFGNLIWQKRYS